MRPFEKFLIEMREMTEQNTEKLDNLDEEDKENVQEDEKCVSDVPETQEVNNCSTPFLQCFETDENVSPQQSTADGCTDEIISLTSNADFPKVVEEPVEVDEFHSRETIRKLVNVDDKELARLIELAENVPCIVPVNKNLDEMQDYCIKHCIKADFTVTRKQFLRYREKIQHQQEMDFSYHPQAKKRKEYEVEAIVDYDKQSDKYFVKWLGWDHKFNTWEPESHLESSRELLDEFLSELKSLEEKNCIQEWNNKVQKLQMCISQFLKKEYDDVCVLMKLCDDPMNFNMTSTKRKILASTQSLNEITKSSFKYFALGAKRVADTVCEELQIFKTFGSLQLFFDFIERRKIACKKLKDWETEINTIIALEGKSTKVYIENTVDLEGPPLDFTYITECKLNIGEEKNQRFDDLNKNPVSWCTHKNCYDDKKNCCPKFFDSRFLYTKDGALRDCALLPIVECNSRCSCGDDCPNRSIQKGTQVELIIFRTNNGRGWGVKAKERIYARRFVMEYIGEIITVDEANERGRRYDSEGRTYLFDLDFDVEHDCEYSVDATKYGNVSHFVNHSCDPNLEVFVAWINHLDRQMPRLVFFSKRHIAKGEELTFDYKMTRPDSSRNDVQIECKCGSKMCKKFLYI